MESATAEIGSAASNYQVLAKLATGGMAELFLARSAGVASVQRYVVLKRVLRDRASDVHFVRMFLDEARLAAQLQHPNIAQVFDVGKLGDSYFFTMEYVHGQTVRNVVARALELHRSPPLGCVLAIAAGAAAGLQHAHTRIGIEGRPLGIVHRDVSPSNLMIGYDGSVKLVDFGVAKAADRVHETRSGAVKGKIGYLSPEQARGLTVDRRSDLFSLGIVLWEMLTVDRLYKHDSDFAAMSAIIADPTPAPSTRRSDVPAELDALVLRALAKSPDERFQSAEEMGEEIERVAVKTGSALSTASLARFVRELFGVVPEPWQALDPDEPGGPEIVTVTSEPIPKQLEIPINDPIDRRLAALVDLSVAPESASLTPMARPTTQMPRAEPDDDAPRTRRRAIAFAVAVIALAILLGVITAIIGKSGGGALTPSDSASVARAEPDPIVAPIESVDAAAAADSEVVPEVAPEVAIDAEVIAEAPADAALAEVAVDAAPVERGRPRGTPRPPVVKDKPKQDDHDIVADCVATTTIDRATCILAACRLRDRAKACRWLKRFSAEGQTQLARACTKAGLPIDPKNLLDCPD